MSSVSPLPPALPNIEVPVIDPKAGKFQVDWYKYFLGWDRINRLTRNGGATTVAKLPSAAASGIGARSTVTDATATTFHSTVAGGGANTVPVFSDGTNWLIG